MAMVGGDGYGQPPQQMMQPHAQQGIQPAGQGGTVLGVPLEPGERVVFFKRVSFTGNKIGGWILGILLAPVLIGFWLIYVALNVEKKNPNAFAVTDRRVIYIPGLGKPAEIIDYRHMADIEPKRQDVQAGGGLVGALASAAVSHVMNKSADKKSKAERKYWDRTIGIKFKLQNGGERMLEASIGGGPDLGFAIGQTWAGMGPQMPLAQYEA
jgi:hypothetical protein